MRLNLNKIILTIRHLKEYIFPVKRLTDKFQTINNIQQIETFIEEKSAHVVQTTLYGYIKTRMGLKYTIMFEDEKFLKSMDIAKWNIYVVAVADCTFYSFSYLINKKGLKRNDSRDVFLSVLAKQKSNGLSSKIYNDGKMNFDERFRNINWQNYFQDDPFKSSGNALYKWSPIADNLKELDKEIVLNSIKYKWNNVKAEFEKITANSNFNI
ncbi:MAG: hypothetical protein CBE47_04025 [Pelagibacteraceae bacterium TMED287]|nr:MAG: hypothetical protein CBE47_04025 [Pelagibacteraceae bacterium TMED287]